MEDKPSLYVESSIFSYYLNRRSADIITVSRQLMAIEWWDDYRKGYKLFVSALVRQELSEGDKEEVEKRKTFINKYKKELHFLRITQKVLDLAEIYFEKLSLPEDAKDDSVHLALTSVNKMDYLLTWNLKHFARCERAEEIRRLNTKLGKHHPHIVTPEDLIEPLDFKERE